MDSASHEYAGAGGVLDMQEAEFERMGGRDSAKMASWIKPKGEHKKMMQRLLQTRAHLILCFRAEPKIEMVKEDGKTKIVPKQSLVGIDGWIPLTEKTVPFELTVSLLLTPDHPGIPKPIKLQEQHRALFPLDKPITEESGRKIAEWAAGAPPQPKPPAVGGLANPTISLDQEALLTTMCKDRSIDIDLLKKKANVAVLGMMLVSDYGRAKTWIEAHDGK